MSLETTGHIINRKILNFCKTKKHTMIDKNSSLEDILDHTWGLLGRGGADGKHPFHYPAFATFNQEDVQQRIVVMRDTKRSERQLIAYSDIRSQKIEDIRKNGRTNWLFYDHGSKEQIRAKSSTTIHHQDELARELWEQIPPKARGDYIGPHQPGTLSDTYIANLPDDFLEAPSEENTAQGINNFCVLVSEVDELFYLKLMKGGHLRAHFNWEGEKWKRRFAAP
jgi:hypothetical protein